jgi:signal transduction histidine kinase/DNA-binding response OmpR family regulator
VLSAQQELSIRQLDRTDGLSQNSVFAITQDADGFMWLGTRNGLNKYDGASFTTYRQGIGQAIDLVSDDIRELYFDEHRELIWIGTSEGLSSYHPIQEQFKQYPFSDTENKASPYISSICSDHNQRVWIGSSLGLHYIDQDRLYTVSVVGLKGNVSTLVEDHFRRFWIGTTKGLYLLTTSSDRLEAIPVPNFEEIHITTLHEDQTGAIWIGTQNTGVFRYTDDDNIAHWSHQEDDPTSLSHNTIRAIKEDQNGTIYMGTLVGLNRFQSSTQQLEPLQLKNTYEAQQALSNNSIHSLFCDDKNGLWIGTYYGGVSYYNKSLMQFQTYRHIPTQSSINFNVISSFLEDAKGNYWIGTEGGGLNYWNTEKDTYISYEYSPMDTRSISGNNVKTILPDKNGLWIGTYQNGLNFTTHPENGFEHFQHDPDNKYSISNNNVYSLLKTTDTTLWVATYGGGLNKMNTRTEEFEHFLAQVTDTSTISSNYCRVLFQDQTDRIWIGTDAGLNVLNDEATRSTFTSYLTDFSIYSIEQTEERYLWLGTAAHGLVRFDIATQQHEFIFDLKEWKGTTVYGILVENETALWLSTSQGLFKYDSINEALYAFGNADGLENLEYNFNAYYQSDDGQFFFGSTNGFTTFQPERIQIDTTTYPLVFTSLNVSGATIHADAESLLAVDINHTDALTFDYGTANFTIEFAVLNYADRKQYHYAYRLKGIDQEWIEAGKDLEATYTIQRPGDYTFQLKSTNSQGIWSDTIRTIDIEVRPPWWQSTWAYVVYFGFIGVVFWSLLRYYRLRESYRLAELAKQQQATISDMKQRFFTNITHEFRTPLTLIISPLEDMLRSGTHQSIDQLRLVHKNANRLLALVNQLLSFKHMETDHFRLRVRQHDVVAVLKEIYTSFEDKATRHQIDYRFDIAEENYLLWFDQEKMEKVFYNLLSNAFKFTPDGGRIAIQLASNADNITIRVADNGKGITAEHLSLIFDRFYKNNNPKSEVGSGIGLAVSKELVELHQGTIEVESQPNVGTTFRVVLRTGNSHFQATDFDESKIDQSNVEAALALVTPAPSSIKEESTKKTLLVVEDHLDIAHYVRSIFEQQYDVHIAVDGKEGYKKAHDLSPDLIISDITMPKMNGIDLCRQLKSELATSHIPIILLTARTTSIHELEGLKIGADDYITKPFDTELLRLKVSNIIQTRQRLYERIAVDQSLHPKEIAINSTDQLFLEQLLQIIDKHLEDAHFDIASFSQELAVSRSTLYKKIKSLTNQTPKSLLKEMRLKRAAQLLSSEELKISEVAYRVGFNDPKYFARCFQQKYGCTPTDYLIAAE